jgi:hypothetical protein
MRCRASRRCGNVTGKAQSTRYNAVPRLSKPHRNKAGEKTITTILSAFQLKDICAQNHIDDESRLVGLLLLLPAHMQAKTQPRQQALDPLMQVMIRGDGFPNGFANGHTLRGNASLQRYTYTHQAVEADARATCVVTRLQSRDRYTVIHRLTHRHGHSGVEIVTTYANEGDSPVTPDMLAWRKPLSITVGATRPPRSSCCS